MKVVNWSFSSNQRCIERVVSESCVVEMIQRKGNPLKRFE